MAAETTINFVYGEETVRIHTTLDQTAESIEERLERRGAEYEREDYDLAEGSTKFIVKKDHVRSPKKIIKT